MHSPPSPTKKFEQVLELYGDLVYDLCVSVLWSNSIGQTAFRIIMKELKHGLKKNAYFDYRRSFVLKITYEKLKLLHHTSIKKLTPAELVMLDHYLGFSEKINQFESYFHRLPYCDIFLLLLKDKYGLPYSEIANSMSIPEGSLKTQRQMAYRALEEWIWESS